MRSILTYFLPIAAVFVAVGFTFCAVRPPPLGGGYKAQKVNREGKIVEIIPGLPQQFKRDLLASLE